jgi:hypothetical protein
MLLKINWHYKTKKKQSKISQALLMGRDMLSELEHLVVNLKSYVKDENRKHVSHSINIMSLSNPS